MEENQEIELKLRVMDEDCWPALCAFALDQENVVHSETLRLAANYFDTADGALQRARLAYRVRAENDHWVATLKGGGSSGGGLHQRFEWNAAVQSGAPDLRVFAGTAAEPHLAAFFERTLCPIVRTEFCRRAVMLTRGDAMIEAALDRGRIIAASSETTILELELELKRGSAAALLSLGAALAERFPLALERRSKFLRGLILGGQSYDAATEPPYQGEVMRSIYRLLDFIYEAWARGGAIDGADWSAHAARLRGAFPKENLGEVLALRQLNFARGASGGAQRAVSGLLRCWENELANPQALKEKILPWK